MSYHFVDYDDEVTDLKFSFGQRIDNHQVGRYNTRTPLFGYDFIDLSETDYHFKQDCFDNIDSQCYFEKVKELSSVNINDLIDGSEHSVHFHFYSYPKGRLRSLLNLISKSGNLRDEELPSIGQFALYTTEGADRTTGKKSPRIYFMLGPYAVFYILFYDPFHEIN